MRGIMIYFIQDTGSNAIKIGHSGEPLKRLAQCQTGSPHKLIMIGVIDGGPKEERQLHRRFKKFHLRGEWFRGDNRLLEQIRAMPLKELSFKEWLARQAGRDDPTGDVASDARDDQRWEWKWDGDLKSLLSRILTKNGCREARAAALQAFREYQRTA